MIKLKINVKTEYKMIFFCLTNALKKLINIIKTAVNYSYLLKGV